MAACLAAPPLAVHGSGWNGSFGLALRPAEGLAVAVASNIQLDRPGERIERLMDLLAG